jgi:F0F1-type ATP synthase assembly protein I
LTSGEKNKPWWVAGSEETDLPPGFPERPDIKKVRKLQKQLAADRNRGQQGQKSRSLVLRTKTGKQVKDIGSYTLIPMMMVAGPMLGFGLGYLVQRQWGGGPWPGVIGMLFGLVAAFRQIFIMLAKKNPPKK